MLSQSWRLPTLPLGIGVPSALTGLTSLFGMGRGGPRSFREGSRVARGGGDRPSSKIFSRLRQPAGHPVVHRVVARLAERDEVPLAPCELGEVLGRPDVVRGRGLLASSVSFRPLAPVSGLPEHALAQPAPAWAGVVKTKAGVLSASAVSGLRRHALRSLFRISVVYSLRQRGHQIGRFSASVSVVIRWSFLRQVGQVIHPSCAGISISDFMMLHKPFPKIIYFPRSKN